MAYHCPTCSRTILSRRNKLCGFCGNPIPDELLFTAACRSRRLRRLSGNGQRHASSGKKSESKKPQDKRKPQDGMLPMAGMVAPFLWVFNRRPAHAKASFHGKTHHGRSSVQWRCCSPDIRMVLDHLPHIRECWRLAAYEEQKSQGCHRAAQNYRKCLRAVPCQPSEYSWNACLTHNSSAGQTESVTFRNSPNAGRFGASSRSPSL